MTIMHDYIEDCSILFTNITYRSSASAIVEGMDKIISSSMMILATCKNSTDAEDQECLCMVLEK